MSLHRLGSRRPLETGCRHATSVATVTAQDGTNTGATLIGSGAGSRVLQQLGAAFGTYTNTLSVWLKAAAPVNDHQ